MAIDSRQKRASIASFGLAFLGASVVPDGSIGADDRQTVGNSYYGIATSSGVSIGATSQIGALSSTGGITRERVLGGTSQLDALSSSGGIQSGEAVATSGGAGPRKRHRQFVNLNGNLVEVGSYKEAVSLINHFNKGKKKPNNLKKRRITFANGPYVSVYDSEAMPLKEIKKNLNIFHDDEDMLLLMLMVA